LAGQQFLASLADHPWFEVTVLAASARSAGKAYLDAIRAPNGAVQWFCTEPLAERFAAMTVRAATDWNLDEVDVVFTALESDAARELEPLYAREVPVISTASAFRYEEDVPILIPAVNTEHAALLERQQRERNWRGFIVPIPNCTTTGLAVTLKPLQKRFGIVSVIMTSLQACSGAGRTGGVLALDIVDNIIPFIPKEEDKVQTETRKILGTVRDGRVEAADFGVSCTCTRVPVLEGHTEAVFVALGRAASLDEVREALATFARERPEMRSPSAPRRMITVRDDPFRPQPRLDRDTEEGMSTVVGRLREDPVLPNGVKYVLVSHNTKMGAAKGAVWVAETLVEQGWIRPRA
jgi:aspartate-semialdehyde dehydrogenase